MKLRGNVRVVAGLFPMLGLVLSFSARADGDMAPKKALFDQHCKKCHAEDGSGKKAGGEWLPVAKTLKLEKPELLSLLTDEAKKVKPEDISKAIVEGKNKMKAAKVTTDEAKQLSEYVLHLQGRAK